MERQKMKPLCGLAGCVRHSVFEQWIRQICFFTFPGNYPPEGMMRSANRDGNEKEMERQKKRMLHQDFMNIRKRQCYFSLCMTLYFFFILKVGGKEQISDTQRSLDKMVADTFKASPNL